MEQTAVTRPNARVWTEPSAQTGRLVTLLEPGSAVILIGEPVRGPVRLDTDDEDDWYQVRLPDETEPIGWVWADRLNLDE
jgi:hypothetical protein